MEVYIIPKGVHKSLSRNLNAREIHCKCEYEDCTRSIIAQRVVDNFQVLRDHFDVSLTATSGFRCQRHNADTPDSSNNSNHKYGMAIDIEYPLGIAKKRFYLTAKDIFDHVIEYETFIHCAI